ncbi:MAG: hypothetical protein R2748_23185 [Bryobacterales bacterium]
MALFTDGDVSTPNDLVGYEADIQEVGSAAGIDLAVKLELAHEEVGAQLDASSRRPGNVYQSGSGGWQTTSGEAALARYDVSQIVVTPPLKLWVTFQALTLFFRDAHTRRANDKYLAKWREYGEMAKWARELLLQTGIGLAANPIPRPRVPEIDSVGSTLGPLSMFVRMTWLDAEGRESAGSAEKAVKTLSAKALRVTPKAPPAGVTNWNVYVGQSRGEALKQNADPLPLGSAWVMTETGIEPGAQIGDGQPADMYLTAPRYLQRG